MAKLLVFGRVIEVVVCNLDWTRVTVLLREAQMWKHNVSSRG